MSGRGVPVRAVLKTSTCGLAILLTASFHAASAQQCPPNSHPIVIAIPGNLNTAHCWCNDSYRNLGGVCVRIRPPPPPDPQTWPPPSGGSMNPVR
jgi:hypothetical protein